MLQASEMRPVLAKIRAGSFLMTDSPEQLLGSVCMGQQTHKTKKAMNESVQGTQRHSGQHSIKQQQRKFCK